MVLKQQVGRVYSKALESAGIVVQQTKKYSASVLSPPPKSATPDAVVDSTETYRSPAGDLAVDKVVDSVVEDAKKINEEEGKGLNVELLAEEIIVKSSNFFAAAPAKDGRVRIKDIFKDKPSPSVLLSRMTTEKLSTTQLVAKSPAKTISPTIKNDINIQPTNFVEDVQLLSKVEVFRGYKEMASSFHERGGNDKFQFFNEKWEQLTKEFYDMSEGKYLLCRIIPYTRESFSRQDPQMVMLQEMIVGNDAILPIFNEYFIIVPPRGSTVFKEETVTANVEQSTGAKEKQVFTDINNHISQLSANINKKSVGVVVKNLR